jgi:hypothetical protein
MSPEKRPEMIENARGLRGEVVRRRGAFLNTERTERPEMRERREDKRIPAKV